MSLKRGAFTLIEVMVSIALFGLIVLVLNKSVDLLRASNLQLVQHLQKSEKENKVFDTLYRDILSSEGNLTIEKDEFTRLCMEETLNSLYALPSAKVCWLVHKEQNTLIRVEGNNYTLPTAYNQSVVIDRLLQNIELFDVYHKEGKVLVIVKTKDNDPVSFMIQKVNGQKARKIN